MHWGWLCKQYHAFARLLKGPLGGARLGAAARSQYAEPGYYFQAAASAALERRKCAEALCGLGGEGQIEGRPWKSISSSLGVHAEASVQQDSATVIDLLTKAYEQFKERRHLRMILFLASQMAQEYHYMGDYEMAKRFFERVASVYQKEKWWRVLGNIQRSLRNCAVHLTSLLHFVKCSVALLSANLSKEEEATAVLHELHGLVRLTPSAPCPFPPLSTAIWLDVEAEQQLLSCAAEWSPRELHLGQMTTLTLRLTSNLAIPLRATSVQLVASDKEVRTARKVDEAPRPPAALGASAAAGLLTHPPPTPRPPLQKTHPTHLPLPPQLSRVLTATTSARDSSSAQSSPAGEPLLIPAGGELPIKIEFTPAAQGLVTLQQLASATSRRPHPPRTRAAFSASARPAPTLPRRQRSRRVTHHFTSLGRSARRLVWTPPEQRDRSAAPLLSANDPRPCALSSLHAPSPPHALSVEPRAAVALGTEPCAIRLSVPLFSPIDPLEAPRDEPQLRVLAPLPDLTLSLEHDGPVLVQVATHRRCPAPPPLHLHVRRRCFRAHTPGICICPGPPTALGRPLRVQEVAAASLVVSTNSDECVNGTLVCSLTAGAAPVPAEPNDDPTGGTPGGGSWSNQPLTPVAFAEKQAPAAGSSPVKPDVATSAAPLPLLQGPSGAPTGEGCAPIEVPKTGAQKSTPLSFSLSAFAPGPLTLSAAITYSASAGAPTRNVSATFPIEVVPALSVCATFLLTAEQQTRGHLAVGEPVKLLVRARCVAPLPVTLQLHSLCLVPATSGEGSAL